MRFILFAYTAFIHIHTLFLSPSLLTMIFGANRQSPIWERAIVVALVNIALCIMGLTLSSYVAVRNGALDDIRDDKKRQLRIKRYYDNKLNQSSK